MKNKILILTAIAILGVNNFAFNSFAEEINNGMKQERQMKERPENEIFGKITAISENSVTISLAEMKKPEEGQKPFGFEKGDQNNDKPEERKELTEEQKAEMKKNFENMFTLTGETKTIDISKADFNAFGRGQRDNDKEKKDNANQNNNINNSQKIEKSYKDYNVGDYISIELESKDSTTAKSVKGAFMMRGGMPPRDMNGMPQNKNEAAKN